MLRYRCKKCNIATDLSSCPNCGERTEVIESSVYWCDECNVPIFTEVCPVCGSRGKRVGTDARPVFPEERLLVEILLGKPLKYKFSSVWQISGQYYYVDGQKIDFSIQKIKNADAEVIRSQLSQYAEQNSVNAFEVSVNKFIEANRPRFEYITSEATQYIRSISDGFSTREMFVSFSGGKDSTVVSSLVMKALSSEQILHIFGDTTLEFPETYSYVERFKKEHPNTLLLSSRNKEKNFEELCEQIGPPSRVMRWCCTIFKTGAIQRKITSLFKQQKRVLTFYGIRRSESTSRSKYDRASDSPKIAIQKTVSPIIDWLDFDVWLYLLTTKTDFNYAYRLGYTRVGCWCCPNNSSWSGFLSKIYMPEQYAKFRTMLINFAKKVGKPDPEIYVDEGKWKARQGGNGLEYASKSAVIFEPCVLQEDTINFELQRPITPELYELFKPFGYLDFNLGNPRLGEVYVLSKSGALLLKLQGKVGSTTLKVSILNRKAGNSASIRAVEDKVKCQITKYQMCIGCLACESICMQGAINILTDHTGLISYSINNEKCIRCAHCITHYDGGCYIKKVVRIKADNTESK